MTVGKTYYDRPNMEGDREGLIKYEADKGKVYYQLEDDTSKGNLKNKKTKLAVTLCILLTEMCERLTYYSLVANIVLYGSSELGFTEVTATTINQVFGGFVYICPIFGGFISDSYAGRFKTILVSGLIYLVGLLFIPASAIDYESWGGSNLGVDGKRALFLTGLVFVGIGSGGIKSNVGPFGAEQVQSLGKDAVQSFFNWFYWVINVGAFIAYAGVSYIQQEISFAWGFFVPLISMLFALAIFVGAKEHYIRTEPNGSVLTEVFGVCRQGCCKTPPPPNPNLEAGSEKRQLARAKKSYGGSYPDNFVEGVYSVVKVMPFCVLVVMFWAVYTQTSNTFYVQGTRMNVELADGVNVPVAALNIFNTISIIILIPLVDRVLYPFFVRIGKPLTHLKRMAIGMVFAALAMFTAGIVEIYRKKTGFHDQVLSDKHYEASSLSVFAQVPQFALVGTGEIFTSITSLEFAYHQAPVSMQGVLTGLFLAATGVGSWLSTAILLIVEKATQDDPWWGNEINKTHMEYLMFMLGGMMMVNFVAFCIVSHYYTYQDPSKFQEDDESVEEDSGDNATNFNGNNGNESDEIVTKGKDNPAYGSTE